MGNKTLEHLLKIETEAAALVNDAQEEADKRLRENDERNRIQYETQYKTHIQLLKTCFDNERDVVKKQYQKELDNYRTEISNINTDNHKFSILMEKYITNVE